MLEKIQCNYEKKLCTNVATLPSIHECSIDSVNFTLPSIHECSIDIVNFTLLSMNVVSRKPDSSPEHTPLTVVSKMNLIG